MSKVKLKRLKIEKYRNVAPGTVLEFNDGFNVLLGQNGTGKTTLLKLIAMVTASRFESLKETEFSLSYTLEYASARVDIAIENRRSDSKPLLNEPFSWSYRIEMRVDQPPQSINLSAAANQMLVSLGNQAEEKTSVPAVNPFERNFLASAFGAASYHISEHGQNVATVFLELLHFESRDITQVRRFDEVLGGLDSLTGVATSSEAPSAAFQFVRPTNGSHPRERDRSTFIPSQLLQIMKERSSSSRSLDWIVVEHENIDFLSKAVELMGFKKAQMILRLRKREPVEGGERLTFGHFEFTITLDDETVIPHESLSYGQKRLLAFLYYVAANDDVIIAKSTTPFNASVAVSRA